MSLSSRSGWSYFLGICEFIDAEKEIEEYSGLWQKRRSLVLHAAISAEHLLKVIHSPGLPYFVRGPEFQELIEHLKSKQGLSANEAEAFIALRQAYNDLKHGPKRPADGPGQLSENLLRIIETCLDVLIRLGKKHLPEFEDIYRRAREAFLDPMEEIDKLEYVIWVKEKVDERKNLCKGLRAALEDVSLWSEFVRRREQAYDQRDFQSFPHLMCAACGEIAFEVSFAWDLQPDAGECFVCGFHIDRAEAGMLGELELEREQEKLETPATAEQLSATKSKYKPFHQRLVEESKPQEGRRITELRKRLSELSATIKAAESKITDTGERQDNASAGGNQPV